EKAEPLARGRNDHRARSRRFLLAMTLYQLGDTAAAGRTLDQASADLEPLGPSAPVSLLRLKHEAEAVLGRAATPVASTPRQFLATYDMAEEGFRQWLAEVRKAEARPLQIHMHERGGELRFAGIAVQDGRKVTWHVYK